MRKYIPCKKCGRLLNSHVKAVIKEHERTKCGAYMCIKRVKRTGSEEKLRIDKKFISEVLA